jgi:hypothetical protein
MAAVEQILRTQHELDEGAHEFWQLDGTAAL